MSSVVVIFLTLSILLLAVSAFVAAPIVHWRLGPQSMTNLAGGISGFLLLVGLAFLLGDQPLFRAIASTGVVGGLGVALALRSRRSARTSIRPYAAN